MQTLADMRGVGVKIGENMWTSFVDGPLCKGVCDACCLLGKPNI